MIFNTKCKQRFGWSVEYVLTLLSLLVLVLVGLFLEIPQVSYSRSAVLFSKFILKEVVPSPLRVFIRSIAKKVP